jgi:hypothetical protein
MSMSQFQLQILLVGLGVVSTVALALWSATSVRYQITPRHLRVTWLGVPVRWICLTDIKHVSHISQKSVIWAERWPNVLLENRRTLIIRRRRGFLKNFVITPKYPFEFKATLEQAVLAQKGASPVTLPVVPDPTPGSPTGRGDNAKSAA